MSHHAIAHPNTRTARQPTPALVFVVPLILAIAVVGWAFWVEIDGLAPGLLDPRGGNWGARASAFEQVFLDEIGEDPRLTPQPPNGHLPICPDVDPEFTHALRSAFSLMRGTAEGRRLYDLLVANGVCVGVTDLAYNSAYTASKWSPVFGWSRSVVMVDRSNVRSTATDVLAAILVHEATHLDRAIKHTACYYSHSCQLLANGVEVDEEVAAHASEAQWWIAAYGAGGKHLAFRTDYSENHLAKAYLRGPAAFRAYVTQSRSDPREGKSV